jgi:glycosyltransferase involved in cell wall biosynthesis
VSVAAVMLVKDEIDVIEHVVRYLARQVDELIVADNESTDGTFERLDALRMEIPFHLRRDETVGYYQAQKTSALAAMALEFGHQWVVPCDADEVWYATDGRTIAQYLGGLAPDVAYVTADLYNHLPSALDQPERCDCGWAEYRARPSASAASRPAARRTRSAGSAGDSVSTARSRRSPRACGRDWRSGRATTRRGRLAPG